MPETHRRRIRLERGLSELPGRRVEVARRGNTGVGIDAGGWTTVDLIDLVVAVIALITAAIGMATFVRAFLGSLLRVLPPRRSPELGADEEPEG